jgi:hypothetical protein
MGMNLFQPLGSTAPSAGDHQVDVSGASCPHRPFSKELDDVEINTRIHSVLTHRVDLSPGAGPAP